MKVTQKGWINVSKHEVLILIILDRWAITKATLEYYA